jgi:RNA polymerase sigma factor (sigma-70 family)
MLRRAMHRAAPAPQRRGRAQVSSCDGYGHGTARGPALVWTSWDSSVVESSGGRARLDQGCPAGVCRRPRAALSRALATRPRRATHHWRTAAAEDIAQEAFLAAVRNLDRFDRRRPFGPWLHRIVVNRAIDWIRARKLRGEVELGEHVPAPAQPELVGSALARIAELTPEHRAVVVLRYVLEYTPGEIADLLDLPRGTVNSRLRRGLARMKADE